MMMTGGSSNNWQIIKKQVLERDNCTCQRCGKTLEECNIMDVHHKIARRFKGANTLENLITYCRKCHKIVEPALSLFDGISRMSPDTQTLPIKKKTKDRLNQVGKKGQTYDDIVNDLVDFYQEQNGGSGKNKR